MTPREEFEGFVRWLEDNGVTLAAVEYPRSTARPIHDTRWLADAYEADRTKVQRPGDRDRLAAALEDLSAAARSYRDDRALANRRDAA